MNASNRTPAAVRRAEITIRAARTALAAVTVAQAAWMTAFRFISPLTERDESEDAAAARDAAREIEGRMYEVSRALRALEQKAIDARGH